MTRMHTTQVKLKLNNKTDADILDWIHKQRYSRSTTVQGEIKRLIRAEIASHSEAKAVGVHRQDHGTRVGDCRGTPTG